MRHNLRRTFYYGSKGLKFETVEVASFSSVSLKQRIGITLSQKTMIKSVCNISLMKIVC